MTKAILPSTTLPAAPVKSAWRMGAIYGLPQAASNGLRLQLFGLAEVAETVAALLPEVWRSAAAADKHEITEQIIVTPDAPALLNYVCAASDASAPKQAPLTMVMFKEPLPFAQPLAGTNGKPLVASSLVYLVQPATLNNMDDCERLVLFRPMQHTGNLLPQLVAVPEVLVLDKLQLQPQPELPQPKAAAAHELA